MLPWSPLFFASRFAPGVEALKRKRHAPGAKAMAAYGTRHTRVSTEYCTEQNLKRMAQRKAREQAKLTGWV